MKFESVKTFILTILVGLSLLLTFGLWTYQPEHELLNDTSYINEVDIGGIEEAKKDIIEPDHIIFHKDQRYFGYEDPINQQNLYKDMQSWPLYNFHVSEANGAPAHKYQVEVIFPDAIPLDMLHSLFTLDEEEHLPGWSFQHVYITFDQASTSMNIQFLSIDGRKQATAVIDNTDKYNLLWSVMSEPEGLSEYTLFEPADTPIYLPKNQVEMARRSLGVKTIDPNMLVNALFSNPSLVSTNIGEAYYTDGQRGMSVLKEGRSLEFINPIQSYEPSNPGDLIDSSITNINEHRGWTDEYKLEAIDRDTNNLCYRMRYEGYPVYNNSGLSIIEQSWRNQELHQYRRPLISLNNSLGGDVVNLKSGSNVIHYLENNAKYEMEKVNDIQVGYHLKYLDNATHSLTLEPAWYMNYNGHWQEIDMGDQVALYKGGN
ncbi:MAG TPA: two-component system activity regulator YycH [Virgibacillus sp.]|nr:two-component system activity regulator YycH [Virgibacillus sp.]